MNQGERALNQLQLSYTPFARVAYVRLEQVGLECCKEQKRRWLSFKVSWKDGSDELSPGELPTLWAGIDLPEFAWTQNPIGIPEPEPVLKARHAPQGVPRLVLTGLTGPRGGPRLTGVWADGLR
jgi:hypothetical protein